VDDFIGFLELAGWIAAIVTLSATVTYAVIKLFPAKDEKPAADTAPKTGS
jgi:hypothetical protein